jgi:carbon storage regulator
MLVLTRKDGEKVVIGSGIRITIVAVEGDRVRVGVTAPPEVRVDREEIHRRVAEFVERE